MPKRRTQGRIVIKKIVKTKPAPKKKAEAIKKITLSEPKVSSSKTAAPKSSSSSYSAKNIQVLEGLQAVQKRPGMYIGSTGAQGLHHLIWETVDNSIDEAMGGYCDTIITKLLPNNWIEVIDNGRGIPVDIHPKKKISALQLVLTTLHAGGKFGEEGGYKVSGGLHGVGVSVVNALSTELVATVCRDGKIWQQKYKLGKPQGKVKSIGKTKTTGTSIAFRPDAQIFETLNFEWKYVIDHLRQQAYLTKGVKIIVIDERSKEEKEIDPTAINFSGNQYQFFFEGGIASYVKHINKNREPKHENVFYTEKREGDINIEIALQYTGDYTESLYAFANNITNPDGGMHVAGFRTALTRTLNTYARNKGILKEKDQNLSGDDVREGLTAIISIKIPNPQFEGQTKIKLNNPEVKNAVAKVIRDELLVYFDEHPKEAKAIIDKAILSYKAKAAAKAARDAVIRKSALESTTLPGKLADCISNNPADSELYIVEGDSAGGSAKQGRDRHTQAVLPLRGKIINTHKYRVDRVLGNNEFKDITTALGVGIGTTLDIGKLRYHKVIIMSDADVDGLHITTLVLTLLFRFFNPLIDGGFIYVAQPPLHKVEIGKKKYYFLNDNEKDAFVKKAKAAGKAPVANRFKGLGEMNPQQLWDTTMDPETRALKQVHIADAEEAEKVFEMLMGAEVPPRRRFIQKYAKRANLDV